MVTQGDDIAAIGRILDAEDPWAELLLWLEERRALNQKMGGDDRTLINLIAVWVAHVSLPVVPGGRK